MPDAAPHGPWEARESRAPLHLTLAFESDALVLGAGTRLGVADRRLFLTKRDSEAFDEARVAALLAVACGRAVTPSELRYVRGALLRQSEGETTLALTHLALANLPKLHPPDKAAWRLSTADGLLKGGMAPAELLSALGLAPASAEIVERAYDPDQPRVPAGSGETSGQWTSDEDGEGDDEASAPAQSDGEAEPAGVQIASDSDDWAQYLNPVGSAEAAENDWRAGSGLAPNARHDLGVASAVAKFRANGYDILSESALASTSQYSALRALLILSPATPMTGKSSAAKSRRRFPTRSSSIHSKSKKTWRYTRPKAQSRQTLKMG